MAVSPSRPRVRTAGPAAGGGSMQRVAGLQRAAERGPASPARAAFAARAQSGAYSARSACDVAPALPWPP
jgi:hypothetical protein